MSDSKNIEVDLENTAVGPRVIVSGEFESEEIESQLPEGWTVGENWANGVKLANGSWSYPLVRE